MKKFYLIFYVSLIFFANCCSHKITIHKSLMAGEDINLITPKGEVVLKEGIYAGDDINIETGKDFESNKKINAGGSITIKQN
jgi:hypothetical protein